MTKSTLSPQVTRDSFLGGRLQIFQPKGGFRSGHEAVFLAAACRAGKSDRVLELGCGTGAASLALASRMSGIEIDGIDRDNDCVDLARANAHENGFSQTVRFHVADVAALPRALRGIHTRVIMNPPFHDARSTRNETRAGATHADESQIAGFTRAALLALAPKGTLTAIISTERLPWLLAAISTKCGGIVVFPLWPRAGEPAKRVIVEAVKGSRAPLVLAPGLVLHGADTRYEREAEAILRHGAPLNVRPQQKPAKEKKNSDGSQNS